MRYRLVLFFIIGLFGCSQVDIDEPERYVKEFHALYQAGKYNEIYYGSSSELKKSISEKDFIDFMDRAKKVNLGDYNNSFLKASNSITDINKNKKMVLIYHSKYKLRSVNEKFTLENTPQGFKLMGYSYTE